VKEELNSLMIRKKKTTTTTIAIMKIKGAFFLFISVIMMRELNLRV
jgi:hypothetical protein